MSGFTGTLNVLIFLFIMRDNKRRFMFVLIKNEKKLKMGNPGSFFMQKLILIKINVS